MKMRLNFSPAKWPFFYGWVVLVFGTLGTLMSIPGQTIGMSAFTDHLLEALGVSRNTLSLAYLTGTAGSALCLTWAGRMYDRFGARLIAGLASAALGCVLLALTQIDRWVFFLHESTAWPVHIIAFTMMAIGFLGIRFFGQGVLTMTCRNMVMKWFDRRRGLANSLMGVFIALFFSGAPAALNSLILVTDWRSAWLLLAAITGLGFPLLAFFFFRDDPLHYGLEPDGAMRGPNREEAPSGHPKADFTLSEARRTYAFWPFNLGLMMFALYTTGFTFHVASIFETAGMNRAEAYAIFLPGGVLAVIVQFTAGWASDYIKLKYLLLIQLAAQLVMMLATALLSPGPIVWLLIAGNGVMAGLFGVLLAVTWPRFYGLKHLGAISGYSLAWTVAGSAVGPYLFSLSHSLTGHYSVAAWLCLSVSAVLWFMALKAERPAKTQHTGLNV